MDEQEIDALTQGLASGLEAAAQSGMVWLQVATLVAGRLSTTNRTAERIGARAEEIADEVERRYKERCARKLAESALGKIAPPRHG
jgi:hypothetical protein